MVNDTQINDFAGIYGKMREFYSDSIVIVPAGQSDPLHMEI
jgi:hypothetical protein